MSAPDFDPERQLAREKVLYQYSRAMARGDLVTVAAILRAAQGDAILERMLFELAEALATREPAAAVRVSRPREALAAPAHAVYDVGKPPLAEPHTGPGMSGSLRRLEPRGEDRDQAYSEAAAELIVAAYRSLEAGHTAATDPAAFERLRQSLRTAMAPRQRLRGFFASGLAYFRARAYAEAIPYFDEALHLAHICGSHGDHADLLYLRGRAYRSTGHVEQAATDLRTCLKLIRAQHDGAVEEDVAFELAVLARLAKYEFLLAQQSAAEECVTAASQLLLRAPDCRAEAEQIAWVQALLHRWRGQPELALKPAAIATDIAKKLEDRGGGVRLHVVMADVCLDLAERLLSPADRGSLADLAGTHLRAADELLHENPDNPDAQGQHIVVLTRVRFQRVSQDPGHGPVRRLATLEHMVDAARQARDRVVLAQACTALGDELMAQGATEKALGCYRDALRHLEGTEMPALGIWARRALYKAHEMRG